MAQELPTPELPTPEVEANRKLKEALSSQDAVMPKEMPSVLLALWDAPNTLSKVDKDNQISIQKAGTEILTKPEWKRTAKDLAILSMYEQLFPTEATVSKQLALTNQPSSSIKSVLDSSGIIDKSALLKLAMLSPEQIKEQFKTLNKWDLKLIIQAIDTLPNEVKTKLKETLGTILDTMMANGFSIENKEDLKFLQDNWTSTLKEYLGTKLNVSDLSIINADLQKGKKYVLKNTNNVYTINALISEDGKPAAWLDLSKLNTLDTKTATADIQKKAEEMKQAGQSWNMDSIRTMMKWLEKLWGIGKFLALIFGAVFGISENSDKKEQWPEKAKTNLEKRNILTGMSTKKDRYDISTFFDENKKEVLGKKEDPKFQEYLKDVYAIIGKEIPKDQKPLEYSNELRGAVVEYEKGLKIPAVEQTGLLSKTKIDTILNKYLDDKGEVKWKPESTPEVISEKPHPLKDVIGQMRGKSFMQIRNDRELVNQLQTALNINPTTGNYDKATIAKVKEFQMRELEMQSGMAPTSADGKIWKFTIIQFDKKFQNGMIQQAKSAQAAAK